MSDRRGQLPEGYDLDEQSQVEKKRRSRIILFATIIIGIVLIILALFSGFVTFPDGGVENGNP